MLAAVNLTPFLVAVMICWIFSVCVHEFAHALVAYWGGDTSVRSRGYLRFNPFAYVHPVTSILLPLVLLAMGGIPLPGGAVRINRSALRSPGWAAAVSAAGPASNFMLFLLIIAVIHPAVGIIDPAAPEQPNWVRLLGAMAVLQLIAVFVNLIPMPPLDGFGIIEPYLNPQARARLDQLGWIGLFVLFFVVFRIDAVSRALMNVVDAVLAAFGMPWDLTWRQYNLALFGASE